MLQSQAIKEIHNILYSYKNIQSCSMSFYDPSFFIYKNKSLKLCNINNSSLEIYMDTPSYRLRLDLEEYQIEEISILLMQLNLKEEDFKQVYQDIQYYLPFVTESEELFYNRDNNE